MLNSGNVRCGETNENYKMFKSASFVCTQLTTFIRLPPRRSCGSQVQRLLVFFGPIDATAVDMPMSISHPWFACRQNRTAANQSLLSNGSRNKAWTLLPKPPPLPPLYLHPPCPLGAAFALLLCRNSNPQQESTNNPLFSRFDASCLNACLHSSHSLLHASSSLSLSPRASPQKPRSSSCLLPTHHPPTNSPPALVGPASRHDVPPVAPHHTTAPPPPVRRSLSGRTSAATRPARPPETGRSPPCIP